jgi:hypothetical protein
MARSLHPIGTRLGRRVGDELTPRHRRPELLHNLSDHPLRNCAITRLHSPTQHGNLAGPGSRPDSAPIAAPASPYGLGFATTGALLNHGARMT